MVLFDIFLAALLYLWQVKGIHGAKTFLECWLWFCAGAHIGSVMFGEDQIPAPVVCRFYDFLSSMVVAGALLYFGFVALPITLFIGWAFFAAKNSPKEQSC